MLCPVIWRGSKAQPPRGAKVLRATLIASVLVLITAGPSGAALLFDDVARADFESGRGAEFSPLAAITVSAPIAINQIGARVDLNSDGHLRFLIFDLNSQALLFSTASGAYIDDGLTYKLSPVFSFVLNPGITYGIGAIADVGGAWSINNSSGNNDFTQNNITADDDRNGNVSNFVAPALGFEGTAMIMVRLYGGPVPEPATLSFLAAGFAMLAVGGRRLRRRRS